MNLATASNMTPTQRQAFERRRAFRASIAARAIPEIPIIREEPIELEPIQEIPVDPIISVPESESKPEPAHWFEIQAEVPSVAAIQVAVASFFGVTRNDILSARREANIVLPRHIAVYLAKELTPFTYPALGRFFGGRDHTSALHAVRRIQKLVRSDENIAFTVATLLIELNGDARL
jgi:hypothetical protein